MLHFPYLDTEGSSPTFLEKPFADLKQRPYESYDPMLIRTSDIFNSAQGRDGDWHNGNHHQKPFFPNFNSNTIKISYLAPIWPAGYIRGYRVNSLSL